MNLFAVFIKDAHREAAHAVGLLILGAIGIIPAAIEHLFVQDDLGGVHRDRAGTGDAVDFAAARGFDPCGTFALASVLAAEAPVVHPKIAHGHGEAVLDADLVDPGLILDVHCASFAFHLTEFLFRVGHVKAVLGVDVK